MTDEYDGSRRFKEFISELKKLCDNHKVGIVVNGYDCLIIEDREDLSEPQIWCCGIDDRTTDDRVEED